MKTKFLIVVGAFLLSTSLAFSQSAFKVLTNSRGDNSYKTSSTDWSPLKTGTQLNSGDELKTTGDCYVVLLSAGGKLLELKEPKEYKVDDLIAQVPGGGEAGVVSKYADFVMSKMSSDSKEENRKKYSSVTGATQRGFSQIKFFMASSSNVYNTEAIVRWKSQDGATAYEVSLMDWFGEPIMVAETTESFYRIDFTDERLKDMEMVIVNVNVKGDEESSSGDYAIQRVNSEDAKEYSVELETLKSSLDDNSAISNLILAEFYEQNNLLLDALTSYEVAINESPDVEYFRDAYLEFLLRNGYNDAIE
jgi:hypothetical protein